MGIIEAALTAARIRLRPVMMTAISTILGAMTLLLSRGAGAAGRHSIGGSVVGGMMTATFMAVFFVPLFFVMIQWVSELGARRKQGLAAATPGPSPQAGSAGSDEQGKGPTL
jgi:multidrug efflux pump